MNKIWTIDELERMTAEHGYYEMKITEWEKQRILEDAVQRFKDGEDFSKKKKETPEEVLERIRNGGKTKKAPKKRVSKANTMPKPLKDVYIPPVDSDEVIDLQKVYEQISDTLYSEELDHLDDEIQFSLDKLHGMYTRGQLQSILLGVIHDLIKQGGNDFVLIKHDDARKIYEQYSEVVNKLRDANSKVTERKEMRENALKKLTAAERELLGL